MTRWNKFANSLYASTILAPMASNWIRHAMVIIQEGSNQELGGNIEGKCAMSGSPNANLHHIVKTMNKNNETTRCG